MLKEEQSTEESQRRIVRISWLTRRDKSNSDQPKCSAHWMFEKKLLSNIFRSRNIVFVKAVDNKYNIW